MSTEPKFYTVVDIARFLGISENSVYTAVRKGELSAVRVGKIIRVSEPSYLAWVDRLSRPDPEPIVIPTPPVAQVAAIFDKKTTPAPVAKPAPKPILFPLPPIDIAVSVHPGVSQWLRRNGYKNAIVDTVRRSDVYGKNIFGVIPLNLAVHAARVYVLRIGVLPRDWKTLTADEIENGGPFIEAYSVEITDVITGKGPTK